MRSSFAIAMMVSVLGAGASNSVAQEPASPVQPAAAPQADTSAADKAFEPLRTMMDNLATSLSNTGGVREQDHKGLRYLRDRAAEFSRQFPADSRGLAIELQISMWLKEDDLVDDLFGRLAAAKPDDANIPISHAQYALNHNRFAKAIEVLKSRSFDPSKNAQAFVYLSDALIAEHEFVEASDALKMIPKDVLEKDPFIKVQVDEKLKQRENYAAEWDKEQAVRSAETAANDLPQAVIKTARGEITLELFENQAPNTVANFISLAEKGFYNGTKFHRVIPNFMAQGGDPNSKDGATGVPGQGDPGYYIPDEIEREDHRKHFNDSIAMAKTAAPNTGGCQFYLTVTPTIHLNGIHTVFGRVLVGKDVVRSLQGNDVIESITITRKREHPYVPTTMPLPGATPATAPTIDAEPITIEPLNETPATQPETPATAPATP